MADRYWVGGTGTWDASSTANWSATSGGASGASAPTSADNVFFDAGSDAGTDFTVTLGTGAVCNDITAGSLDFVMTLAMTNQVLRVYGDLSFPSTNLTVTGTGGAGTLRFSKINPTVTTNGVTIQGNSIVFDSGGTLGSAIACGNSFVVSSGIFSTNNFNITNSAGGGITFGAAATINLGSSTVTCSGNFTASPTTVFNAGTSTIICSSNNVTFAGGGLTFHNVSFTSTSGGTHTITGANTFNDLTFTSLSATGIRNISIDANQTVTGTLTLGTANTAIRRMFMRSNVVGTPRTITATTMATIADVDFRDINNAGTTWTGTRLGNCGGNTGITFDAPKTVYCVASTNQNYINNIWALSSGGAVDVNNFPLAQDTAIFDANSTLATLSFNSSGGFNTGAIDFSALTTALTVNINNSINLYGDLTLDENVTMTGTQPINFAKRDAIQKVTTVGKTITNLFGIEATTLQLQDTLTVSNSDFYHNYGTLDLNGFDCICVRYAQLTTLPRSINFGTNKIVLTGNALSVIGMAFLTNFTYTGTPRFEANYSGSVGTRTFDIGRGGGATESNVPDVYITAGSDIIDLRNTGQQNIRNLDFTGFTGSTSANQTLAIYGDVTYSAGMTVSAGTNLRFLKSSGTQTLTTNGKTIDFPISKQAAGTLQLADNLTLGSTRTLTHTAGTIDLNDFDLTTGLYSSTGSTTRQLDFGTGDLNVEGASFTASGSNFTTAGTGKVSMNSASSKTFAGGGFSYKVLNQGGTGQLTITGANTFSDISNTVQPCTITFPAGQTTSVQNLTASGTAGNLVTLNSSTPGTQWTLAKV